jgi:hypothetical protein
MVNSGGDLGSSGGEWFAWTLVSTLSASALKKLTHESPARRVDTRAMLSVNR